MGKLSREEKRNLLHPKTHKKCPRCGTKCVITQVRCDDCGLVFDKLKLASNKAAKQKIKKFDKDYVIYTNQYPNDISRRKLILLVLFTGLVGGHYYYVGKYIKGIFMSLGFSFLLFFTIFNAQIVQSEFLPTLLGFIVGIYGISWMVSLVRVCFKQFKVPIYIGSPVVEDVDYRRVEVDTTKSEKNLFQVIENDDLKVSNENDDVKENK